MPTLLTFMWDSSAHNDCIKGFLESWGWSPLGAGHEGTRDFFTVHWQIDTPKGFFVDRRIDMPKGHLQAASVDVRLHVASPTCDVDPVLNDLKKDVIHALLRSAVDRHARASGLVYKVGRLAAPAHVQGNKTTEAFRVVVNPHLATPTYKGDIEVVHAAIGEDVDQVLQRFADRLTARFGP